MSQDRFCLLQRLLHFSDNRNPCPGNRLVKIGTVVETLRKKFKSIFIPHQNLCIDESIVEWKGRLTFKQYIPSKRHRFGIKLFVLCDCKSGFVLDFWGNLGKTGHWVRWDIALSRNLICLHNISWRHLFSVLATLLL